MIDQAAPNSSKQLQSSSFFFRNRNTRDVALIRLGLATYLLLLYGDSQMVLLHQVQMHWNAANLIMSPPRQHGETWNQLRQLDDKGSLEIQARKEQT